MVDGIPYLPYILKDIVGRVSEVFENRDEDSFEVYFDYGLYASVAKNLYKSETNSEVTYPLVWLVINTVRVDRGSPDRYGDVKFDLIIAMPTDPNYTSEERTENTFRPRLYPVYDELLTQISLSEHFLMPAKEVIDHQPDEKHYWGGTEKGTDAKNLFENYIDAIHIRGMSLQLSDVVAEEYNILNQ